MEMMTSKAVKEAFEESLKNRLTATVFISDLSARMSMDQDGYIKYEKNRMLRNMAEEIYNKMDIIPYPGSLDGEKGTRVRGECYVFTKVELLQLLDRFEDKLIRNMADTIYGMEDGTMD